MVRKPVDSWGSPAKFLHWLIAALVLVQIALGWSAVTWRLSPLKLDLFVWHKSIGLLILGLMLLRVLWRFSHRAPELPAGTARWERHAARLSHLLLYGLLLAMPLSGWIVNSAANIPVRVFWLVRLPNLVDPSKATEDIAARVHLLLFGVLALLLLVHVGAALRHHFVLRDNVLLRMLPGTRGGT
jgi:cytochrome b561